MMKAAVVSSFDSAPRYEDFRSPTAPDDNHMVVDMVATGLHPRVLSQANGSHYTSTEELPLIPGIDGVGRGPDGLLRYFILPDTTMGSMAEQTVIDARRSVVLPEDSDATAVAAGMNPAMSSWIALRSRVHFEGGQNVLVLGATGNAGRMAVQVARLFGANQIVAAGRDAGKLADLIELGATDTLELDQNAADALGEACTDVDVVIDYLWGEPTASAMLAVVTGRSDRSKPLTWIEVGSVAGIVAPIPSAALRAARLQIVGSGQGSVSTGEILGELPDLAREITAGTFDIDARPVPLSDVEQAWADAPRARQRIVITPQP